MQVSIPLLEDFLESIVMDHVEVMAASASVHSSPPAIHLRGTLRDWSSLSQLLADLRYDPVAPDDFHKFGMFPKEGPTITRGMLEQRWDKARLLLSLAGGEGWSPGDKVSAEGCRADLEAAFLRGWETIPNMARHKAQQQGKQTMDTYKEACPPLLLFLDTLGDPSKLRIATQWSTVSDDTPARPTVLPSEVARKISKEMYAGNVSFLEEEIGGTDLVLWAPQQDAVLGRLLGLYLRAGCSRRFGEWKLLVPLDTLEGCNTISSIMDVCWHPMRSEKWAPIIKNTEFVAQPMAMIGTKELLPNYMMKSLAIFTVHHSGGSIPPSLREVAAPLFKLDKGPTYVLDMPIRQLPKALAVLQDSHLARGTIITRPYRSPISSKDMPRLRIDLIFKPGTVELETRLRIQALRQQALCDETYIGGHMLFSDPLAKIFELTHEDALSLAWPRCGELLPLSRSKALGTTQLPAEDWIPYLTDMINSNADVAILKIKHKPSFAGGRVWAAPEATPLQLAATRRCAGRTSQQEITARQEINLSMKGNLGGEPQMVISKLVEVIAIKTGIAIQERQEDRGISQGACWTWEARHNPAAAPGQVRLYLQSEAQVQQVVQEVQGRAIDIGGDLVTIEVSNDFYTASATLPKNGKGARGGRPLALP